MLDIRLITSMKCEQASELLSDALDRPLTFSERLALRLHVPLCRGCRMFRAQMEKLRSVFTAMPEQFRGRWQAGDLRLSDERRSQIKRLLTEAKRQEAGG